MKARSTIKESTLFVQPETNLRDIVAQMTYTRDKKMKAKETKKQTTLYNQPEVNLKDALANRSYVKDNNMIAKKTKKTRYFISNSRRKSRNEYKIKLHKK